MTDTNFFVDESQDYLTKKLVHLERCLFTEQLKSKFSNYTLTKKE